MMDWAYNIQTFWTTYMYMFYIMNYMYSTSQKKRLN